jgi:preprotein translocase subunit SecF
MFNFAAKRHWFLLVLVIVVVFGVISAAVPGGLKLGWDFRGGFQLTLAPNEETTIDAVKDKLTELEYGEATGRVQETGGSFLLLLGDLSEEEQNNLRTEMGTIGTVVQEGTGYISPSVASETARNAAVATGLAMVAMLIYITLAFRKVPHSIRYGTAAVAALVFNLLVVLGVFSILGRTLGWEIDPMFITAILAIIGYSVNDSIVVLDRIRENKARGISPDYDVTVNFSISQTLVRSLNTSITTLLAVLAVYLIVGGPIRSFLLALFLGIVAGAYSSIFVAGPLLVFWERREWSKLISWIPRPRKDKA